MAEYPIRGMPSPIVSKAIIDGSGTDAEIKPCVSKSGLQPTFVMVKQDKVFASCREVTDTDSKVKEPKGTNFVLKLRAVKFCAESRVAENEERAARL